MTTRASRPTHKGREGRRRSGRYYGKVAGLAATELAEAIEERERIESVFTRAIYYAHLWYATDTADAPRGALVARLTEKGAALRDALLFFGLGSPTSTTRPPRRSSPTRRSSAGTTWRRNVRKFRPFLLN